MTYTFAVTYKVEPGTAADVEHALRVMTHLSRQEPGNVVYRAHAAQDEADTFMVYEVYDDEASFQAHRRTPYFAHYFGEIVSRAIAQRRFVEYRELAPVAPPAEDR